MNKILTFISFNFFDIFLVLLIAYSEHNGLHLKHFHHLGFIQV